MVTSDSHSGFFELDYLPDAHSETIVGKLKNITVGMACLILWSMTMVHNSRPPSSASLCESGSLCTRLAFQETIKPKQQLKSPNEF